MVTTDDDWGDITAHGATLARQAEGLGCAADDVPRVLAAALAWAVLLRYWTGAAEDILHGWRSDVPAAMAEVVVRTGIRRT